ncbi:peptidyl-prolyl cis-trans isomerase-like protein [Calocera cornea HHB12733]|uniref:Peptidyl-prolyl cis-trans isomerase n=1 Tax=Calocera cornea HHB12733 TaxID=1353952 RepID=A0A165F556_9BASI|nr:peptidyl-prolyl cis-trans isomerase-like protein [Calocera cornea HHB12733]
MVLSVIRRQFFRIWKLKRNFLNRHAFFDISIDGTPVGRITISLRDDVVPQTAQNFAQLCMAPPGVGYRGTVFQTIVPGWAARGGDTNGRGGRSIWGSDFADENFNLPYLGRGVLAMNNPGPNRNGSQFFITLSNDAGQLAHLQGRHVAFGSVQSGWEVLDAIEQCGSASGTPGHSVMIYNCGML